MENEICEKGDTNPYLLSGSFFGYTPVQDESVIYKGKQFADSFKEMIKLVTKPDSSHDLLSRPYIMPSQKSHFEALTILVANKFNASIDRRAAEQGFVKVIPDKSESRKI